MFLLVDFLCPISSIFFKLFEGSLNIVSFFYTYSFLFFSILIGYYEHL